MKTLRNPYCLSKTLFALSVCLLAGSPISHAATIYWTDWTSTTVGTPSGGSALGNMSGLGVNVSYTGEVYGPRGDGVTPSWNPISTYSGGFVGNAPLASFGSIPLSGGQGVVDTLTFSQAVVDPVMAIWSLGGLDGTSASFIFQTTAPITLESGGPSAEFGGSSISVSGNTVSGNEGNGTVEFHGTFSQISWTSTFEPTYNFTIGAAAVPEPTLPCLMFLGLLVCGWYRRQAAQRKQA
ncbi:MAG TPA: hypothetical protein VKV04_07675 [Verrucomicrobiae bacterium]|nr:hypothetical protein [Verrucomicrobiae bacterium]